MILVLFTFGARITYFVSSHKHVYWGHLGSAFASHKLQTHKTILAMGLLPDMQNCGLRMRRECKERFPHHQLQRKPLLSDPGMHHGACVTHVMHAGIANPRWRGKRSRHSRRMRNPPFCVSGKRPMESCKRFGTYSVLYMHKTYETISSHCQGSCFKTQHISPLDTMAAISQTIFSDAFSWMKSFVVWLKFHWSLFLRVQ